MRRFAIAMLLTSAALACVTWYFVSSLGLGTSEAVWRCWLAANPADVRWSSRVVAAQCRDFLEPVISPDEIWGAMRAQQGELLDEKFEALLDQHSSGARTEVAVAVALYPFTYPHDWMLELILGWRKQRPASPYPMVAEGIHFASKAVEARGGKFAVDVTEEQWSAMRAHAARAIPLLKAAVAEEPRLLPAWTQLIQLGRITGDEQLEADGLAGALAVSPDAYLPRRDYLQSLLPQWGGSVQALRAHVEESRHSMSGNPRWELLDAYASYLAQASETGGENSEGVSPAAVSAVRAAPDLDAIMDLVRYQNQGKRYDSALLFAEQGLRFRPLHVGFLRNKAYALGMQERYTEALQTMEIALGVEHSDPELLRNAAWYARKAKDMAAQERHYLRILSITPEDAWYRQLLAELYLYNLGRIADAEREVGMLIEQRPESGISWLLRLDVLAETGGPGRIDAAKNFIRYVDETDEVQARALPAVRSWLREQGQHAIEDLPSRASEPESIRGGGHDRP